MIPFIFDKEHSYDVYSKLFKNRIIFLSKDINKEVASDIIAQLLSLNIESRVAEISLYIMSCGGEMTSSFAIFDTMKFIEAPVATFCIGEAASGAALLLAAGSKGKRFALPTSRIMIHQLRGGTVGTYTEMDIQHEEMKKMEGILVQKLTKITGKNAKTIEKDISNDLFLSPEEAKSYGLIDKVLEHKHAI